MKRPNAAPAFDLVGIFLIVAVIAFLVFAVGAEVSS